jgi:hypothetical protein
MSGETPQEMADALRAVADAKDNPDNRAAHLVSEQFRRLDDEPLQILERAWFDAGEIMSTAVEQIIDRETAKARAQERQRIAAAIEAHRGSTNIGNPTWMAGYRTAQDAAARMARGEA